MNFAFPPSLCFTLHEPMRPYAWAGVVMLAVLVFYFTLRKTPYATIPANGRTDIISSYIGAIQLFKNAKDTIEEGYYMYRPGVFRIPQLNRWHVIVSGEDLIEELRKAPDDTLSFLSAVEETISSKHMLGTDIGSNPYHAELVRVQLTRNLGNLFPDVRDEIVRAFKDNILPSQGWTKVRAYTAVLQIVTRTSNRVFVGAPLCRDPEYIELNIRHTLHISKGRHILAFFPNFLKPLAASLLTNVPKSTRLGLKHLRPIIEERQRNIDEYGPNYPEKPNDFLSWLMNRAEGKDRTPWKLTTRILALNFGSIHTTAMSFTHAVFHLASCPEYIYPIRKEVEAIITEEGWTKHAISRMRKLDSFLKESQRFNGLMSMTRKALKKFTFSNGTRIPKGAMVSVAAQALHHDEEVYTKGSIFNGFRFSNMQDQDEQVTNQYVSTSPRYLAFGHGRHACPGRFFAAHELKAMMAHLVLLYDIKMENEGVRPENQWFGFQCIPNTKAEILFRSRQT